MRVRVNEAIVDECHPPHPSLLLCVSGAMGVGQRLRDLDDRHGEVVAGVHIACIVL